MGFKQTKMTKRGPGERPAHSPPLSGERAAPPRAPMMHYRNIGNRGMAMQAKLNIGQPNDTYEREADRMADTVMRMPDPAVQRQPACPECTEEEEETVQAKPRDTGPKPAAPPGAVPGISSPKGPGQTLPRPLRSFFEPRFGADFSKVRLHTGTNAAASAKAIHAKAFTTGQNITFGAGEYKPGTAEGKRLPAHELTHVTQQEGPGRLKGEEVVRRQAAGGTPPAKGTPPVKKDPPALPTNEDYARQFGTISYPFKPEDITEIREDIENHVNNHSKLISWLSIMGMRAGYVGHAAACPAPNRMDLPVGRRYDPSKINTDPKLPIAAHFFPSPLNTNRRALIIGGIHASETPGYQMVEELVREFGTNQSPSGFTLAYHTLIIPVVNRGARFDKDNNQLRCPNSKGANISYNPRCNRQDVDINRNFPIPPAPTAKAPKACLSSPNAPTQPETGAIVKVIRDFQPHRILATHAIGTIASAGIYADPNTHPGATALACAMAGKLQHKSDRRHNKLNPTTGQCDARYPGDPRGGLPKNPSLGRYAYRKDPHQPTKHVRGIVPVITLEAPGYGALGPGTGARTVDEFKKPLRAFLSDTTPAVAKEDRDIITGIRAFSNALLRTFLTGRLPSANAIHNRIRRRVQNQIRVLNQLRPRPPKPVFRASGRRAFSVPVAGSTPQSKIFFEKFTLTGGKNTGWDTLPTSYYNNNNRSQGVNHLKWRGEKTKKRLNIILKYTALPGTSRHHWGTDVDFNSTKNKHWGEKTGYKGGPGIHYSLGQWLRLNAARAGFLQVYTPGRFGGHSDEPWHFTYAPLSVPIRRLYNQKVQLAPDIITPLLADWTTRANNTNPRPTLPSDLQYELAHIGISKYVNTIGSEL